MKGISAVIATLNRTVELKNLFESMISNNLPNLEVIVVDQNENDLLVDVVAEYSDRLNIVHLRQKEPNQSKARNYGASMAKYSIVCFPDDDCWFEDRSLIQALEVLEHRPEVDLLIINWRQNPYNHPTSKYLTKNELYTFRSVGYVTYVQFFRREAFNSLGGYIENIGIGQYIGGGEDSELTFRALQNNMILYYDASIKVNHNYIPINARDFKAIRARQRGMGMVYAKFDVPLFIAIRGLVAPFVKMVLSLKSRKRKEFYNILRGRWEGFLYTRQQIKKEFNNPSLT